jgi:hypothetical protein
MGEQSAARRQPAAIRTDSERHSRLLSDAQNPAAKRARVPPHSKLVNSILV